MLYRVTMVNFNVFCNFTRDLALGKQNYTERNIKTTIITTRKKKNNEIVYVVVFTKYTM